MGKHRHTKDRLFITTTEHKYEWGGKKDPRKAPYARLPYNCCALSLLPFENPVCTKEGVIFDILNIIPYIKKYKQNPITGEPLKMSDLIKLNFHKNANGEYHDPISFKPFTDHTHIVAIKTSGNVFSYETVEELNRKVRFWKDLLTNDDFTAKDIITIQDPTNAETRSIAKFDYVKKNIDVDGLRKGESDSTEKINHFSLGKKIMEELHEKQKAEEEKKGLDAAQKKQKTEEDLVVKPYSPDEEMTPAEYVKQVRAEGKQTHARFTSGNAAASFTSTGVDLNFDNSNRQLTDDEIRKLYWEDIKQKQKKGYVKMITSLGTLNLELHANFTPKACENFIELCEKKYFNNTKFHRLVHDFIIQGGDPTGTGRGGQSIYGEPFQDEFHPKLSHNKEGILSMANAGKNTNKSQFFFTLRPTPHLDDKHTIMGHIVGDTRILDVFNGLDTDDKAKPKTDVVILDTIVDRNPFRETIKELRQKAHEAKVAAESKRLNLGKQDTERWINTKVPVNLPPPQIKTIPADTAQDKSKSEVQKKPLQITDNFSADLSKSKGKPQPKPFSFGNW